MIEYQQILLPKKCFLKSFEILNQYIPKYRITKLGFVFLIIVTPNIQLFTFIFVVTYPPTLKDVFFQNRPHEMNHNHLIHHD